MSPFRKLLPAVLLIAGGTTAGIALAETGLRILGFKYTLYPEQVQFGYPDPSKIDRQFQADDKLFWVVRDYYKRLKEADASGVDIAYLGDSATHFAHYDQYLSEMVSTDNPGKDISSINLGTGGWSSCQGLAQMERDVPPLKPKVATIFFGWNDHWIGFGIEDKRVSEINDSLLYDLRGSRLVQLLQVSVFGFEREDYPKRVSLEDFQGNLSKMVDIARENGIVPILISPPSAHVYGREPGLLAARWLHDLSDLIPLHNDYVQVVRKVAEEKDVILVDAAAYFTQIPIETRVRDLFLPDGIHLRKAGDRIIAQLLYDALKENNLLQGLMRPADQAVHFWGEEMPTRLEPGERKPTDPNLPTILQVDMAKLRPGEAYAIQGWVLSPKPIDHVVLFIEGKNMGSVRYPVERWDVVEKYPEYGDPWCGFAVRSAIDIPPAASYKGKLVVYSGDEILLEKDVEFEHVD